MAILLSMLAEVTRTWARSFGGKNVDPGFAEAVHVLIWQSSKLSSTRSEIIHGCAKLKYVSQISPQFNYHNSVRATYNFFFFFLNKTTEMRWITCSVI